MIPIEKGFAHFVLGSVTAVLVLLPTLQYSAMGIEGLYNQKRIIQLLVFFLLIVGYLVFILKYRIEFNCFQNHPLIFWIIAVLMIIGFLSAFFSEYPAWALLEIGHLLLILLVSGIIADLGRKYPALIKKYVLIAVFGYVSLYLFRVAVGYGLYQFSQLPLWPGSETSVGLFGFADKRFFNQTQTWTLPLLIGMGWYSWKYGNVKTLTIVSLILVTGWMALLLASGGRGTAVSVLLSGFIIIFFIRERLAFVFYALTLIIAAYIIHAFFFKYLAISGAEQAANDLSLVRIGSTGRITNWMKSLENIAEQPLLGYGPMHFASVNVKTHFTHPHNSLIQLTYEWGIFAALIIALTVIWGVVKYGKMLMNNFYRYIKLNKLNYIRLSIYWSILAALIHSFVSGIHIMPLSQIWLTFILGCSIGLYLNNETIFDKNKYSVRIPLIAFTVIVFCFGYWIATYPKFYRSNMDERYMQIKDFEKYHPRFWQQGKIGIKKIVSDNS